MRIHTMSVLLAGTALAAAFPGAASAADEPKAADIIVTATRIVRDGYTAPTPVTVASAEELAKATPTRR